MTTIHKGYIDALGRRRRPPRAAIQAIERAASSRAGTRRPPGTVVAVAGQPLAVGPAELVLEDGSAVTIDRRLPRDVPPGYHRIQLRGGSPARLIVAPPTCFLPESFRTWAWAIQLYGARSRKSWGIGDLADLRMLGRWAARQGAGLALINPLAAAAPGVPQQASPYFPSTRRFRSPLYLRIEEVDGAREAGVLARWSRAGRALNRDPLIDRDAVFRLKDEALSAIWRIVRRRRDEDLDRFAREQDGLEEFARFCVLAEKHGAGYRSWPAEYRHPGSPAVARAARDPAFQDRMRFHQWLQYQVDRQLARASREMPVMQDLPIGFDAEGADGWAFQDVLAQGISVGAPPDEFNTRGQNWGLPPFVPDRLRAAGYEPFAQTIRACLRHAGGLRIDHVMGLFRLFWIPEGMEPADGAYVGGRGDDLLAIVALESQRAKAVIVGEDLGTVDERVRESLALRHILSYRLVWFEKGPPSRYPADALAAVTTHDLPTIAGLWSGSDLEVQKELGLSPNDAGTREIRQRIRRMTRSTNTTPLAELAARVYESLARAPSRILAATLEDAMMVEERPNMPATTDEWPNWRQALPRPIETLAENRLARRIARALARDA
jgi:4-alpha-glucanotransferase